MQGQKKFQDSPFRPKYYTPDHKSLTAISFNFTWQYLTVLKAVSHCFSTTSPIPLSLFTTLASTLSSLALLVQGFSDGVGG